MDAKKIGLLGGRGYVGQEILDLISNHEYLNISSIFSFSKAGQQVDPSTHGSLIYQDLSLDKIILSDEDAFILALPNNQSCLLYTSPSPRDRSLSRMPSSA